MQCKDLDDSEACCWMFIYLVPDDVWQGSVVVRVEEFADTDRAPYEVGASTRMGISFECLACAVEENALCTAHAVKDRFDVGGQIDEVRHRDLRLPAIERVLP